MDRILAAATFAALLAPAPPVAERAGKRDRCFFDADCGDRRACLKTSASAEGLCVGRR